MGRKQAIIDTATRLFAQKGFAETSTAEIAEHAGVAHGTLFYHFKNKRGIIYEIFAIAGDIYIRRLKNVLAEKNTGMAKIEAYIRFNEDFRRQHSQQIRIFQRFYPDPADCPQNNLIKSIQEHVIEMIQQSLAAGVADGTIACGKIYETAFIIHALSFGITHMDMTAAIKTPRITEETIAFCRRALKPETTTPG